MNAWSHIQIKNDCRNKTGLHNTFWLHSSIHRNGGNSMAGQPWVKTYVRQYFHLSLYLCKKYLLTISKNARSERQGMRRRCCLKMSPCLHAYTHKYIYIYILHLFICMHNYIFYMHMYIRIPILEYTYIFTFYIYIYTYF